MGARGLRPDSMAKVTIFIGTFIAIAAFVLDIAGYSHLADVGFGVGILIALLGVALTIKAPISLSGDKATDVLYRASVAGFLIAAVSTMLNAYVGENEWFLLLFQAGAALFILGILLILAASLLRGLTRRWFRGAG